MAGPRYGAASWPALNGDRRGEPRGRDALWGWGRYKMGFGLEEERIELGA